MYGARGRVAHHASNIFGQTGAWDHPAYFFPRGDHLGVGSAARGAAKGGLVKLRNAAFGGPVTVTTADGRPVPYKAEGDTLTLPTRRGKPYRVQVGG